MFNFESIVRYSEIDANRYMTLPAILDLLQDCCTFQSEHLGIGLDYLAENHRAWVLSSWQVIIERYPVMGEKITAQTWAYDFKSFYGYRNFKIVDEAGKVIAYANTIWVFMDTEHGRPVKITEDLVQKYCLEPPYEMERSARKIKLEQDMQAQDTVPVQRFHIDTNQHVNNSKYVMIAEEYLPPCFKVRELRVEYQKAAVLSDILYPKTAVKEHQVMVALENEEGKPYAIVEFMEDAS